jgi:hypothetical protein
MYLPGTRLHPKVYCNGFAPPLSDSDPAHLEEAVALLEEEVVVDELLLHLLCHAVQRVVGAGVGLRQLLEGLDGALLQLPGPRDAGERYLYCASVMFGLKGRPSTERPVRMRVDTMYLWGSGGGGASS